MIDSLHSLSELATTLRNVFHAADREALAAACQQLEQQLSLPPSTETNWQDVEYAFNRLFVGPEAVPAPPYSSVYLDAEPLLMGSSTLAMRDLLRELQLTVPDAGQPDDFLAYELDAWLVLARLCETDDAALREALLSTLEWLTREHMGRWLPLFIRNARQANDTPALETVLRGLECWLEHSVQRRFYEQR